MKSEKILSLLISVLIPSPLIIAGLSSTFEKIPLWAALGAVIAAIISWFLGRLAGILLKKTAKEKMLYIVRAFSVIVGVVITALCEAAIFSLKMGSFAPMFLPLAYVLWYWFGFRTGSGQTATTSIVMGGYVLEAALMYPICASFNKDAAFYIILITAFLTVMGALLINLRQVSGMSLRGKSENKLLTKACARFNVKGTLIFCGIILFAFLFAGVGAKWLWEGIKAVVRYIIYSLSLLGEVISGDGAMSDGLPQIPVTENDNSFWRIIIYIIAVILAIIFFKPLVKFLKGVYRAMMNRLGRKPVSLEEMDYTDIYQSSTRQKNRKTSFKKAFKLFLREKDPTKKYRLGYKAFMLGLEEHGAELSPGDTAEEHCKKEMELVKSEAVYPIAEKYSQVRYDEQSPSKEDCDMMKRFLKEISEAKIPKGEKV